MVKKKAAPPAFDKRSALLLIAGVLCALAIALFVIQDRQIAYLLVALDRLTALIWLALVTACACAGGLAILSALDCEPEKPAGRAALAAGAGFGVISLVVFILGAMGLLHWWLLTAALLGFGLLGLSPARRILNDAATQLRGMERGWTWSKAIWLILAIFFALNLIRAFEPPWEYDTLEYHLGAPAIWNDAGRVTFLQSNVYSNMPQNTEMLYLLAMRLRGDRVAGAQLGFMFNVVMGLLGALAIRAAIGRLHGATAGDASAAIYYAWPGITLYGGTGHVEIAQQFYGIMALCAFAEFVTAKNRRPAARWLILSGLLTGFAIGVKYPSVLFLLIPIAVMAAFVTWLREACPREAAVSAILAGAVAVGAASPWMIRNMVNTGNPVYPLLYGVFGGSNWTALREARWQSRHGPGSMTPAELVRETREFLTAPEDNIETVLLFAFLPLLILARKRDLPLLLSLLGYAVFCLLGWFLFTHRADRFLAPVVPALAALGGVGAASMDTPRRRSIILAVLIVFVILGPGAWRRYLWVERALGAALGEPAGEFFATEAPQFRVGYQAMQFINDPENVSPDARILFFPEARTFWCRRDVISATPFDRSPMEELVAASTDTDDLAKRLRAAGVSHLLVSYGEIGRLINTGDFVFEGIQRKHRLDRFNWPLFQKFIERHAVEVKRFGEDEKRTSIVLYRLAL